MEEHGPGEAMACDVGRPGGKTELCIFDELKEGMW